MFKVGDKVTAFDGEKMFEGIVRHIDVDSFEISNGVISKWFGRKYIYLLGTEVKVIRPPRVTVRKDAWESIKALAKMAQGSTNNGFRISERLLYFIEGAEVTKPPTVTIRKEPFDLLKEQIGIKVCVSQKGDCLLCQVRAFIRAVAETEREEA